VRSCSGYVVGTPYPSLPKILLYYLYESQAHSSAHSLSRIVACYPATHSVIKRAKPRKDDVRHPQMLSSLNLLATSATDEHPVDMRSARYTPLPDRPCSILVVGLIFANFFTHLALEVESMCRSPLIHIHRHEPRNLPPLVLRTTRNIGMSSLSLFQHSKTHRY
jgi:hypothetical protein